MPFIRATFRNGVDDAAKSAAILGLEAARLHLDFFNSVHQEVLADATVLDIRCIDTVDEVYVLRIAGAINLEAGGRVAVNCVRGSANPALEGLLTSAGSKRDHRLERSPLRDIDQDLLVNSDSHLTLRGIHDRSRTGNFHRFG